MLVFFMYKEKIFKKRKWKCLCISNYSKIVKKSLVYIEKKVNLFIFIYIKKQNILVWIIAKIKG